MTDLQIFYGFYSVVLLAFLLYLLRHCRKDVKEGDAIVWKWMDYLTMLVVFGVAVYSAYYSVGDVIRGII